MKVKRAKHVRKVMTFYRNSFGFKPPYTVVIDGTFCKVALQYKINIREQLPKYLDGEVKFCTTNCIKRECKEFGSLLYGPLKVLEQFEKLSCTHNGRLPAPRCMKNLIKNSPKYSYIIASQDSALTEEIRATPGIPLLYLAHNAINLEKPSGKSKEHAQEHIAERQLPKSSALETLKKEILGETEEKPKVFKEKKKKGANPLSCLKKKVKRKPTNTEETGKRKRRSRHKRGKDAVHVPVE